MDSFNEAWNIICEYCKNNTTTFAYDVWIKKIEPVGLDFDKGEVTLLVPNDFHRQTLQKCYIPLLNDAFDSVFGTHFQIVFQVPQEVNNIQEKEQKSTAETGYDFTFDTFIVGSSINLLMLLQLQLLKTQPVLTTLFFFMVTVVLEKLTCFVPLVMK